MKLILLFCFVCFTLGANNNLRKREKTTFINLHLRHKRQIPESGICIRNETYSCTRSVTEHYTGVCPFFTSLIFCTRTRQREEQDICSRQVAVCCDGYVQDGGRCVLETNQAQLQTACSSEPINITTSTGSLTSPTYPDFYPSNSNCIWVLRAPPGVEIRIQILSLHLEPERRRCDFRGCYYVCVGDHLILNDGSQARVVCGSDLSRPFFSSTRGSVEIRFQSNQNSVYRGFQLTYNINLQLTTNQSVSTSASNTSIQTTAMSTAATATQVTANTTASNTSIPTTAMSIAATATQVTANTTQPTTQSITLPSSQSSFFTTNTSASSITTESNSALERLKEIIICLGDQYLKVCTPFCSQRCDNGSVVNINCYPELQGQCRPACACPVDRPVLFGTSCLTTAQCAATYRPPPTCPGGMVPSTCLRTCSPTCENPTPGNDECPYPPLNQCVSGCMCPSIIPINHRGNCIIRELCPRPQPPAITCGSQFYEPNIRIVGGNTAIRGSWPWAAQIIKVFPREKFQCGGTIICENWVLTAAHCFQEESNQFEFITNPFFYRIRIGKHNRSEETGDHVVIQTPQRITLHPQYNRATTTNDVALIRLQQPLQFNTRVRPACMPEYVQPARTTRWGPPDGAICYAIGWGETLGRGPSNMFLKQVRLPIRSPHSCTRIYQHFNQTIAYCVGGRSRDDTCTGDSGGPLLCQHGERWYVDGITSYGLECGVITQPSVYTRVTAYSNWIRQTTGNSCGHPDTRWSQSED